MSDCDVLLLGDYFCDLIITGLSEVPRLGADVFGEAMEIAPGGAYILSVALHRLGVRTRWRARLGNDPFSQFIVSEARREGLDQSLFEARPAPYRSLSVSFSFAHDRGFISYLDPAPADGLPFHLVAEQRPRWVINVPFDGSAESRRFVDAVHAQGGRVYTDCQYVTTTLAEPGLADLLCQVDIFAPNESEARQLTGAATPEEALARLSDLCPLVIVKCGADGALARSGDQVWRAPAIPVQTIDTTGAGDCFNAGFLAARLRGEPIPVCLQWGNIAGGLSTTARGGAAAAPTFTELQAWLARSAAPESRTSRTL